MKIGFEGVALHRGAFFLRADFAVDPGALVAVMGPSGAGKSTLLSLVAGFDTPGAGRVRLGGQDMTSIGPADRPVTMVFQDHNLFPHLSIFQNVALGKSPALRLSKADGVTVEAVLARVGLAGLGPRRPADISGGQRSRAALARALLRDKPVLLLDEPFAALGPALQVEMLDLVAEICSEQGMSLLMVTHDPSDAQRIAEHVVFVEAGRVEAPGPTEAVLGAKTGAVAAYLGR